MDVSPRPGARLAFDVGKVRVGVARCDEAASVVLPVVTLKRDHYGTELDEAADLVEEYGAVEVIVGLPVTLRGSSSSSTRDARQWACELAALVAPVAVRLVDERLTTVLAHRSLHAAGLREKSFRAVVDQVAATVILEQALEVERRTGRPAGERAHLSKRGRA